MPKLYPKMFIFAPLTTIYVLNNGTLCGQTVVSLSAMLMVDAGKDLFSFGLYAVSPAIAQSFEAHREVRFRPRRLPPPPRETWWYHYIYVPLTSSQAVGRERSHTLLNLVSKGNVCWHFVFSQELFTDKVE